MPLRFPRARKRSQSTVDMLENRDKYEQVQDCSKCHQGSSEDTHSPLRVTYPPLVVAHDSGPIQWARGNCAPQLKGSCTH